MNKFALVDGNGEVGSVVHASDDNMFVEGEVAGDQTAHIFEYHINDTEVINNWYWREDINNWIKSKPPRPSAYHYFDNYEWNLNAAELMAEIRRQRDLKLLRSDWTQLADSPLSAFDKALWVAYRAALRDVPANNTSITSLDDVEWPPRPSAA